jgi:hypothetical protein
MIEVYDNIITRDTANKWATLLLAYSEGKEIQVQDDLHNWHHVETITPMSKVSYRIKPEEKYVPFTVKDNLLGKKVMYKSSGNKYMIIEQGIDGVYLLNSSVPYSTLLLLYTFLDGTPCGNYSEQ